MKFGPVLRAIAGIAILCVMDAYIKGMSAHYPVLQVTFLRFIFGSLIAAVVVVALRPGWPSQATVTANMIRSVSVVVTASTFFYALSQLPMAEALILSFLSPMFIALFGLLMLKERVDLRIIGAIVLGFVGTVIVVLGQTEEAGSDRSWAGVAAALISAVTYALSLVLLRQRAQQDKLLHIIAFMNMGPLILIAPFGIMVWQPLNLAHLVWFVLIGMMAVSGHVLVVTAYAKMEAVRLAPLEYTALVWVAAIGYWAFNEIPTWATYGGGALIILGALLTSRR
jgi:S-adenosylmethionine uptake transporter